jgi:hypothetical protein
VPIIAAHNGPNTGQANWVSHVYIEQGNPGDGNFKLYAADRNSSDGSTKDIGYPLMALSPKQDTLYVLGCPLQATSTTPPDNLEFGKYVLGTGRDATWLGWLTQPAGQGLITGHSAGGADVLRIAPNGDIGVLWAQGENDDRGLYYVESSDAGNTWTTDYGRLYTPDATGPAGALLANYDGLDLFFDKSSKPHYIWEADYQLYSNNTFYPYSAMIFSWGLGDKTVNILNVNSASAPPFTTVLMYDTLTLDVNLISQSTYFTPPAAGSDVEPTGIPFVSKVTTAFSGNSNYFRVYYSTFQDGDLMLVDQTGDGSSMKEYIFRSIYFQETSDGGSTWTTPAPFMANNPNDPPENKNDYHLPCPVFVNPSSGGVITYHVNFLVDSFPGERFAIGQAGYTINTWYHNSTLKNKVTSTESGIKSLSLAQNYPNPFSTSTTIPLVMKNDDVVTLSVTDILGREVAVVYHGRLAAGEHRIPCNVPYLGAGIYTYTVKTSMGSIARTMSLVK